jgi:hypothetical protein
MHRRHESVVECLAAEAIRLGADFLDVEYKDGYEGVVAAQGGVGHGIDPAVSSGMIADLSRCVPRPGGAAARRQRPEGSTRLRG